MHWRQACFCLVVLVALPFGFLRAEFYPYELLLSAEEIDERLNNFLQRNLPKSRLAFMAPQLRYQKFPQFPISVCHGVEYHLMAFGSRLIAFGCLSADTVTLELQKMRRAIDFDRSAERRRDPTDLYALSLSSAAAGNFAAARRFAQELRQKRPDRRRGDNLERLLFR